MPKHAPALITALCSLAALIALTGGDARPAGMRNAFELIDGKEQARQSKAKRSATGTSIPGGSSASTPSRRIEVATASPSWRW
jgi:hypothetical protein